MYAERFQYTRAQGDGLPSLTSPSRYWVRELLGERAWAVFLQAPGTWGDTVKEARQMELAERLHGADAYVAAEAWRTLLPVNAPSGFEQKQLGGGIVELLARAGLDQGIEVERKRFGGRSVANHNIVLCGARTDGAVMSNGGRAGHGGNGARVGHPTPITRPGDGSCHSGSEKGIGFVNAR